MTPNYPAGGQTGLGHLSLHSLNNFLVHDFIENPKLSLNYKKKNF